MSKRRARRHRPPAAMLAGIALLALVVGAGIVGPLLSPYDPLAIDLGRALLRPGREHWLGTDQFGRDLLTRIVYAIRLDLPIALLGAVGSCGLGLPLGCLAGAFGGQVDALIGRLIDGLTAMPALVLLLAMAAALGAGTTTIVLVLVLTGWVGYARIVRAQILLARAQPYVEAAQALGVPPLGILSRHLLPGAIGATLLYATSDIVLNLHALAALSFLGLGVPPPTPEWGAMIAEGQLFLLDAWGLSVWPGLMIALVGVGLALLGDGLADWLRSG